MLQTQYTLNKNLAIANRSRVSCINTNRSTIWLPRESHAGMSLPLPVLRVEAFGYVKIVLRNILDSPGYAPGKIAVNVTWIERGVNAGQTPRCIYPSIFNHFWDIAIYRGESWSEWAFYSVFYHILLSPWYAHGTITINVTQLERGFNACKMPRCIYPSIFILQPFLRYSKLLVENRDILIPHLCLAPPQQVTPSEFREGVWWS